MQSITIPQAISSQLSARIYGQTAVNQLEEMGPSSESIAKAYAVHYRVTGRTCSLLMLESERDYRRFNIKPEQEAFVVKATLANKHISKGLLEQGSAHLEPKERFLARLKKLATTSGVQFTRSTYLDTLIKTLPEGAYKVEARNLQCKLRLWKDVPGALQEQLVSRDLTYKTMREEALRRQQRFGSADALKALSSLVEENPGDLGLLREVSFASMQWGLPEQAYHMLRKIADRRPHEPQSYLNIARCLSRSNNKELAMLYFELGLSSQWSRRFGPVRQNFVLQYYRLLKGIAKGHIKSKMVAFAKARLDELRTKDSGVLPADGALVVTMTWNTDNTDIDLHVEEPRGERCYYRNPRTSIGGSLSHDVRQGYGPELYTLPRPVDGIYTFQAYFYSGNANRTSSKTRVYTTLYQSFATKDEVVHEQMVTLSAISGVQQVGQLALRKK